MAPAVCLKPDLKQREVPKFISHDAIALTGGILERFAVLNRDDSPAVVNHACSMKQSGSQGDCSPRRSQHLAKKVMRQQESVRFRAFTTA